MGGDGRETSPGQGRGCTAWGLRCLMSGAGYRARSSQGVRAKDAGHGGRCLGASPTLAWPCSSLPSEVSKRPSPMHGKCHVLLWVLVMSAFLPPAEHLRGTPYLDATTVLELSFFLPSPSHPLSNGAPFKHGDLPGAGACPCCAGEDGGAPRMVGGGWLCTARQEAGMGLVGSEGISLCRVGQGLGLPQTPFPVGSGASPMCGLLNGWKPGTGGTLIS